jgi:hypothetical protein
MLANNPNLAAVAEVSTLICTGSDVVNSVPAELVRTESLCHKSTNFLHYFARSGINTAPDDNAVQGGLVWNKDTVSHEQLGPAQLAATLGE